MGCDIHLHIELKIEGKWEHYGCPSIPRSYYLFTKLAGVRASNPEIEPFSEPRGLPDDITLLTKMAVDRDGGDAHSKSWIDSNEIDQLEEWVRTYLIKTWNRSNSNWLDLEAHFLHSYCFGNSFAGIKKYPESYPSSVEDVRFVFWFDN